MCNLIRNGKFYSVWAKGNALYVRWADKYGIGYPELMVLYALNTMGNLTQKDICENFGLLKQTVNTVIRNLIKEEYVVLEPCKEDKREKLVILTDRGKIYAYETVEPLLCVEEQVCKKIGYERMEQLQDTMELFNILFEKETERGLYNK